MTVFPADLSNPSHAAGLIAVLDSYACEPAGGGEPLSDNTRNTLISALQAHPTTVVILAGEGEEIVGAAVCFLGFSTFQARPLLNIHDLAVLPAWRGKGIGHQLLQAVESAARERNCCKLTLEVLEQNTAARRLYAAIGFTDYELGEPMVTHFLSKSLNDS